MIATLIAVVVSATPALQVDLRSVVETYQQDRGALLRRWDAEYSPTRRARLIRFYQETQQALHATDFGALDREGRADYVLLDHRLTYERTLLSLEERRARDMAPLLPFAPAVFRLHEARRDLIPVDGRIAADSFPGPALRSVLRPGRAPGDSDVERGVRARRGSSRSRRPQDDGGLSKSNPGCASAASGTAST